MCRLCSKDKIEVDAAREYARMRADEFEAMAWTERGLANGTIQPHSDQAKSASAMARSLIRYLVEEWM